MNSGNLCKHQKITTETLTGTEINQATEAQATEAQATEAQATEAQATAKQDQLVLQSHPSHRIPASCKQPATAVDDEKNATKYVDLATLKALVNCVAAANRC
ncbi:MAG: hypothetical protein CL917_04070 [Deltaproteobacteria bacterium]|nr:hypothetical protein [Deltaproteobacteria bacterium]